MIVSITALRHREPINHECESGNDSSIFVSEISRISMSEVEVTSDTNVRNLFRIELIFT